MKKCLSFVPLVLGCSTLASATDLPFGGDAVHHQLRSASHVAVATATGQRAGIAGFTLVDDIKGAVPREFSVLPNIAAADAPSFAPGDTYLLFMTPARAGAVADFTLPMNSYSAVRVRPQDAPALRAAVETYAGNLGDPQGLKAALLGLAKSPVAYLQYSAAADLYTGGLVERDDLALLVGLLHRGRLSEPRARGIVVDQIAQFNAIELTPILEELVRSPRETAAVKTKALDALVSMNAVESLKALAPLVESSASVRLKTRIKRLIEPGVQP